MPNYKTHVRFNTLLALPLWIFLLSYFYHPPAEDLVLFSGIFLYGSYFFHPDVDLAYKIKLFTFKGLMTLPFRLYGAFFRHRGLSHHPFWGTFTRIVWVLLLIALFFCVKKWTIPTFPALKKLLLENRSLVTLVVLGLFLADLSHIGLDRFSSRIRK